MFSRRMLFAIGAIFLLVCCLIWITIASRRPMVTEGPGSVPISIVAPFQKIVTSMVESVKDVWRHYFSLVSAAKENDRLRAELNRAIERNNACVETEFSNQRLRAFLDFKKNTETRVVAAEVIAKDPSRWYKTIIIGKGEMDGVVKGLPAVVPQGVVGQIVMTTANYAKVLLIVDRNSAVDALVQRTRARGIIQGKSEDRCAFQYVLRKHDVKVGDVVISSGLDAVYPKGLRIGRVSSVVRRNAGIFQDVEVTPYVDFEKLEEVLVVLNPPAHELEKK